MVLFWQAKEMTEKSKKNENSTKAVFVFLQTLALLQLLMIPGQDLRQRDLPHLFFRALLHLLIAVRQGQLDVHPHAAGRIGMGVLMKDGFVALHRAVNVQQSDLLRVKAGRGCPFTLVSSPPLRRADIS